MPLYNSVLLDPVLQFYSFTVLHLLPRLVLLLLAPPPSAYYRVTV